MFRRKKVSHMNRNNEKEKTAGQQIADIDEEIAKLIQRVKITGSLDQSRNLIIGEEESIDEAVKRMSKINDLRKRKIELEKCLMTGQGRKQKSPDSKGDLK